MDTPNRNAPKKVREMPKSVLEYQAEKKRTSHNRPAELRRRPCSRCGKPKGAGRSRRYCIACVGLPKMSRWPLRRRSEWLRRRYGITEDDYQKLNAYQKGLCGICDKPNRSALTDRLTVDHNHTTREVRGLLCTPCNTSLAVLERVEWRCRAEMYLSNPPWVQYQSSLMLPPC